MSLDSPIPLDSRMPPARRPRRGPAIPTIRCRQRSGRPPTRRMSRRPACGRRRQHRAGRRGPPHPPWPSRRRRRGRSSRPHRVGHRCRTRPPTREPHRYWSGARRRPRCGPPRPNLRRRSRARRGGRTQPTLPFRAYTSRERRRPGPSIALNLRHHRCRHPSRRSCRRRGHNRWLPGRLGMDSVAVPVVVPVTRALGGRGAGA